MHFRKVDTASEHTAALPARRETKESLDLAYIYIYTHVNGRRTGLVTFSVETAFYKGLLKERYKGE
jgi:hypothetical protein